VRDKMNIGTEVIIKKLEEKMIAIKSTINEGDNQKLTEDLISIKAYCDLLLEAQKRTSSLIEPSSSKVSHEKQNYEKQKPIFSEKPETDSLFDF
jgi:hypothetical protein